MYREKKEGAERSFLRDEKFLFREKKREGEGLERRPADINFVDLN